MSCLFEKVWKRNAYYTDVKGHLEISEDCYESKKEGIL